MNDLGRLSLCLSCFILVHHVTTQVQEDSDRATIEDVLATSVFHVSDNEKLILDDAYCLKSITVRAYLTNDTYGGENAPSMRLDIAWEPDQNVTSLTVETDSQNDTYCDAAERFSYHRKPSKKNMHTFPDIVNYGSRFIPIKLDCRYIITPELMYPCRPLRLKYTTPVCLTENVCSCRNTMLPAPKLEVRREANGVVVHWEVEDGSLGNVADITKICITVEAAQTALSFTPEEAKDKEFTADRWDNVAIRSGQHFFPLNSTYSRSYLVKGVYDNMFECSGNVSQLNFDFPETDHGSGRILLYSIAYFLSITILMVMTFYFLRRKLGRLLCNKLLYGEQRMPTQIMDNNENITPGGICVSNPMYSSCLRDKDLYVLDYRELVLKRKLAEGHFGIVYLATSTTDIKGYRVFAVKQLKDTASRIDIEDFMEEMETLKRIGPHAHIVRLIGYCTDPQPLSIVMEYVPFNLLEYLKNLRDEFEVRKASKAGKKMEKEHFRTSDESLPSNYISASEVERAPLKEEDDAELECVLDNQELESFGLQIARGMAHLEEHSIVHRDLAARNILIDNSKTLKISDFGMSRTGVYVNKTNRQFPLRWMSPEAITERTFSNKSDVWSYGVVLWEIGTLGGFPYADLQNEEVLSLLRKGGHPDQPESVTRPLYNLMLRCWSYRPDNRPTFAEIVKRIENLRQKAYVDFAELREYYVFPPTEEECA